MTAQLLGQVSGGVMPEQITSFGSVNSYNSSDSINSARGSAISKAYKAAQQQATSGMLSEAQVRAQQKHILGSSGLSCWKETHSAEWSSAVGS